MKRLSLLLFCMIYLIFLKKVNTFNVALSLTTSRSTTNTSPLRSCKSKYSTTSQPLKKQKRTGFLFRDQFNSALLALNPDTSTVSTVSSVLNDVPVCSSDNKTSICTTCCSPYFSWMQNDNLQITFSMVIWYLGNVYSCLALSKGFPINAQPHGHWTLAAAQLLVGVCLVIPMWLTGIRKSPNLTKENWKSLTYVGLFAALAHGFSVLALGIGNVSFGQIIKAGEPVFTAFNNAIFLKDIDHPFVYLSLIPIIFGVALASLKELSFSWIAFFAAGLSNQAAALKNVASKNVLQQKWAKILGPENTYAVITILALIFTIPAIILFDLKYFKIIYENIQKQQNLYEILKYTFLSGFTFYVYNEASFCALNKVSPVTHSVANTLKRVFIIIASCLVFKTRMTLSGALGSFIAVMGTLMYSLAKSRSKPHH